MALFKSENIISGGALMKINGEVNTYGNIDSSKNRSNYLQENDSVSKNLRNQIANAQKRLQELGKNEEMPLEEKMKKRQEIQKEIANLNNQLRQHQIELRMEKQKAADKSEEAPDNRKQMKKDSSQKKGAMYSANVEAIISADISVNQAKQLTSVRKSMEGKARVLEVEIKLDAGRGAATDKKVEELEDARRKAGKITGSQMDILAQAEKKMEEAKKEDYYEKMEKQEEDNKEKSNKEKNRFI